MSEDNTKEQKNTIKKDNKKMSIGLSIIGAGFLIALAIFYTSGNKQANIEKSIDSDNQKQEQENQEPEKQSLIYNTFSYFKENEICKQDEKPVIRLFSTTWCPHCEWITETYDNIVKEYQDAGKIIAHHWEVDIDDDVLTPEKETQIPSEELAIYKEFNPRGSIPTFVFGCKYFRVGNGYEQENDLEAEEEEFREIIELLINEK
ncbi:hypothetical protein CL633_02010 [bacterium]|nr:hypothetical protein [bacterium]|tara:strand:- start:2409 stop:3020 length:612 start_codon:yes stop_codon:yes gene_type:complete